MHRNHRHAVKEEPFVPVNPFKMRRKKKFTLAGILSPPPSPDIELSSASSGPYECEDLIPVASMKAFFEDAHCFLTETLPRQLYLNMLLRIPIMYFSRVARIFEDAEISRPDIQRMIDAMCNDKVKEQPVQSPEARAIQSGPGSSNLSPSHLSLVDVDLPLPFPDEWTPTSVSPSLFRFKHSWETFIDSLIREWKTLNVVSALLSSYVSLNSLIEPELTFVGQRDYKHLSSPGSLKRSYHQEFGVDLSGLRANESVVWVHVYRAFCNHEKHVPSIQVGRCEYLGIFTPVFCKLTLYRKRARPKL
jgi:hypothetical protein